MSPKNQNSNPSPFLITAGVFSLISALLFWLRSRTRRHTFLQPQFGPLRGRALITGASSGIGEVFARQLAARGYDLIVVARRENRLQALADELRARYGTDVQVFSADLSQPQDVDRLVADLENSPPLALLVNNAGFATHGNFVNAPINRQLDMISLHLSATVRLTHAALPGMLEHGRGAIINVSSIAAFMPVPGSVVYSATKSFLNIYSETLQMEFGRRGIHVQSLCPGFTHSGFHSTEDQSNVPIRSYPDFMWSEAGPVVEASLDALGDGRVIIIPGVINQAIVMFARSLIFRPIVKRVIAWLFLRPKSHSGPLARSR